MGACRGWVALLAVVGSSTAPLTADEVFLVGGGRVEGVIVERTKIAVVLETGPGRVSVPAARVARIVESRSALEAWREREAQLGPGDVEGWAALARWAAERRLETQSRRAWERVLAADPAHPAANEALGRVLLDGAWMSRDEAHRARGEVQFEGRWVTPAEHEALVRERERDADAARERREADVRVREAEARAREAEARARDAETGSREDEGVPLWWGWGGGVVLPPWTQDPPPPPSPPPTPPPAPERPPSVPWSPPRH